jgi:ribonuclease P protein component
VRQGREFASLRQRGQRRVSGCLIANWTTLDPGRPSRVGVVTSSRLGGAVVRSRARRLLREVFRLHQHELRQPVAAVLVARTSIVGRKLPAVERDFLAAMRQARLVP